MTLPDSALSYWDEQRRVSALTLAVAKRLWLRMGGNFDSSWQMIAPILIDSVEKGQASAANLAADFVPAVLQEQGIQVTPEADPVPESLVGVTGGGASLESALYASVVNTKQAVKRGSSTVAALQMGGEALQMLIATALSDTGRAVESMGVATRPGVGYIRMLEGESCSRCIILAGRFYRWSAGFKRHPRCDCRHLPATAKVSNDLTIDPDAYFRSLPRSEQDARFGAASAQAIRDGADMSQVVNAQKGMRQAQVYGQNLAVTSEGVTKRGVAGKVIRARGRDPRTTPRLMPSAIYDIAEDRADALRLLRANGYVVNRAGVPLSGQGSRTGLTDFSRPVDLDRLLASQSKVADDTTAWLDAERRYKDDVATWLAAESAFTASAPARVISEAQGRTAGTQTWRRYVDTIDADDASLVRVYTGNGYDDINPALRTDTVATLSATKRDAIAALDRVIDQAPRVPENITVSRAVGANVFGLSADSDLMSVVGKPYRDDAFVSTAHQSRLGTVERYEVEIRLDVPAGTRGVYVSAHDLGDTKSLATFGPDENELIIGRGIQYEFTDAFVEDGRRVLIGRITGQEEPRG